MSVIEEPQITGGNGRNPIRPKGIDILWIWKVFGR